jgi:hypothetical protein
MRDEAHGGAHEIVDEHVLRAVHGGPRERPQLFRDAPDAGDATLDVAHDLSALLQPGAELGRATVARRARHRVEMRGHHADVEQNERQWIVDLVSNARGQSP